ncbi:MAG TPA: protein kinase [Ktedonobacteraceae bacterium]
MAIEELQKGRYKYLRRLGSGGMGEVYLMQDTRVNRQVAIKVLRAEGSGYPNDSKSGSSPNANSARLFEREARAIAALEHPNILPLYDFGEEPLDDGSMTYMVMPYCADGSLEGWLFQRSEDKLPVPLIAALIEQAAEGLQYAHEHNVIHLDVKPPNFLIRNNRKDSLRPTLLLADFGISRSFTTVSSSSRTIRGTPAAMAPEQWSGEPSFASDQYALAVMTYEMLVGRPPFVGSLEQLMYRHFSVQPQPPSTFNPRLSTAVDAVLLRALSKKPEDRYPTIGDFASALLEAANQPSAYSEADLAGYSTMTISSSEAEKGLSRMLTLVDGEEITVSVPPGTQNGQVLRLPRPNAADGEADVVLVNIAVESPASLSSASFTDEARVTPAAADAETAPSLIRKASDEPVQQGAETPQLASINQIAPAAQVSEKPPLRLTSSTPAAASGHNQPTFANVEKAGQITGAPVPITQPRRSFGLLALISVLLVLLILAGSIIFLATRPQGSTTGGPLAQSTPTQAGQSTVATTPTAALTPTAMPTTVPPGEYIAGKYNGSFTDSSTNQSKTLSVQLNQTNGSGVLSGGATINSSTPYSLKGTVDRQGNFSFSVAQPSGLPYVFHGQYTSQQSLHGNYCRSATSDCPFDTGYFTVGPRS